MPHNEIYQYSIISALMDGVAANGIPVSKVLQHGDHGLGTFRHMKGEMIVLDGTAYQMLTDGSVNPITSHADLKSFVSPFAQVTKFRPEKTVRVTIPTKASLEALLQRLLPDSKNHFVAYRIDGVFRHVKTRTAAGQQYPGQGLAEIAKNQTEKEWGPGELGSAVGFRSPGYVGAIGVCGDHMHFISQDRKRGGHVLAIESDGEVEVSVAQVFSVYMDLPRGDDEFNKAGLVSDEAGIKAAEG